MKLFHRALGEGPPLIVVHGLYGSSDNWISIARSLSVNFRVYLIDQRNHGRSPHSDKHSYDLLRDDLREFISNNHIRKPVLMGHSMGGKTVMYYAVAFPDLVNSLIVIDMAPVSYMDTATTQKDIHKNILSALSGIDLSVARNRGDINNQLAPGIPNPAVRRFLLKNVTRYTGGAFRWKLNIDVLRRNLSGILDGLAPGDFRESGGIKGFPVLFIRGGLSDYIRDEHIPAIRTIFPDAQVRTFENAGHWLHAEEPERLVQTVKNFLLNQKTA